MKEQRFHIRWANIEAHLKWEFTPSSSAIVGALGYLLGGPALAAITGTAAALVPRIEITTTASIPGVQAGKLPFAYVGSIHRKLYRGGQIHKWP
jgi:hypothetical protein